MKFSISEQGYAVAIDVLGQLSENVQKRIIKRTVRASLKNTLKQAKANVPVRTGTLRDSLRIISGKRASGTDTGAIIAPAFKYRSGKVLTKNGKVNSYYGIMVHSGTESRQTKRAVNANVGGRIVALGRYRGKVAANPFLEKAVSQTQSEIAATAGREIGVGIDQFLRRNYVMKR